MSVDETQEPEEETVTGVPEPLDVPDADDEPGPSDDEQEAEADDDEQAPEPEPEPAAQGTTPEQWEARFKKIERSFNTYTRAVETQLAEAGDDYFRCPLCLGDTPGFLNRGQAGRFPDEQADLVKHVLGLARPVDLLPDPETETCGTCGGEGKTLTGSKVPSQRERQCPTCKGYGYTPPPTLASNGHVAEGIAPPPLSVAASDIEQGDYDDWKQPRKLPDGRENPNYGKMPSYWVNVEPWGDTRELKAQDAVPAAAG